MNKIIILGAGMIGSAIAFDLSSQYSITVVDIDKSKLAKLAKKYSVKTIREDISNQSALKRIVKPYDLVICAVPGFMGYKTLQNIIEAGKNVVDISFFAEDPFKLDKLARQKKVTAVVDCGVAPGLSNIIIGHHNSKMNIEYFECLVGGLPFERKLPFQYKAPFSPIDVIEEYTRSARIVQNSKVVIKEALSDVEQVNIENIGTLESFNTDGLRTLITTMKIPDMKEKTLRYRGHIEYINVLKQSGFFSKDYVFVNGKKVRPIDLSAKLLFPLWHLNDEEKEFTVLQIKIRGKENKRNKEYNYHLFDQFDENTKITSMARTTGYTCSSVARLLMDNHYSRKGISPPEFIGENDKCFANVIKDLEKRKIIFRIEEEKF
ncbi:MAG: saccharopine dehydrogenase C-terminal domain-containing protein [Ignavibacteriaceae bacterium]